MDDAAHSDADRDHTPWTANDLARADKVPRVKTMRWSLQAFVERYRIPLGPLRDREQGQCEPDAAARAY